MRCGSSGLRRCYGGGGAYAGFGDWWDDGDFYVIDAVMLRSLPVTTLGRLYRVGEGDDCCVEGGPQDRWGMFSFPLYERLKSQAPEFEEVRRSRRAGAIERAARRGGIGCAAAAVGICDWELFCGAGHRFIWRKSVYGE